MYFQILFQNMKPMKVKDKLCMSVVMINEGEAVFHRA